MKIFGELFTEQIAILSQFYKGQYYGLEKFYKEMYPSSLYKEKRMDADIYSAKMIAPFLAQKEEVIKKAMAMPIREIYIPFLPVLYFDKKIDGADVYRAQYIFNYCPERKLSENFLIPAKKLLKKRSMEKWSGYWKYYWPRHSQSNANTK